MREYAVVIERGRNCWSAYAPDLPGLGVTGSSPEEVEELMREGIDFHLKGMLEDGDAIPDATTRAVAVETDIVETWSHYLAKSA